MNRHSLSILVLICILFTLPQHVIGQPTITTGRVGYWPADGDANDLSGNNNHGTLMNGATFDQGMFEQAFELDGVDDWVSSNQSFGNDQSHTISAWIFWQGHTTENFQEIVSWWNLIDPIPNRTFLGVSQCCGQGPMRYGDAWRNVPVTLPTNEWIHVAATYDGDTNNRQIYVDGDLLATLPASPEARFSALLAIGRQGNHSGEYWNGLIDELTLYDRVLAPNEIEFLSTPEPTSLTILAVGALTLLRRRVA